MKTVSTKGAEAVKPDAAAANHSRSRLTSGASVATFRGDRAAHDQAHSHLPADAQQKSQERFRDGTELTHRRWPRAYPSSWYRICDSRDLKPGQVRTVHYFGRDIVLFRTETGKAVAVDPFCPHLGAHLGLGRVRGENIQCGFHGWRFDCKGDCTHVPHSNYISPGQRIRTWPLREVNSAIMVYYDDNGDAPSWEMPAFPEDNDPKFKLYHPNSFELRSHPQEVHENGMDNGHTFIVHRDHSQKTTSLSVDTDGPLLTHRVEVSYYLATQANKWVPPVRAWWTQTVYGLGCDVSRLHIPALGNLRVSFVGYTTPIDEENVSCFSKHYVPVIAGGLFTGLLAKYFGRTALEFVSGDIPIWNSKTYIEDPPLVEGEESIAKFREWCRQFYPPRRRSMPIVTVASG